MSRRNLMAVGAGMFIAVSALAQQTFTGVWVVTTHIPGVETQDMIWTVTEADGEYSFVGEGGNQELRSALGAPTDVEVEFDGSSFTITTTFARDGIEFVIVNSGVIDGDTFEGTVKVNDSENRLTGVRR